MGGHPIGWLRAVAVVSMAPLCQSWSMHHPSSLLHDLLCHEIIGINGMLGLFHCPSMVVIGLMLRL